jgi:hypothetical protein
MPLWQRYISSLYGYVCVSQMHVTRLRAKARVDHFAIVLHCLIGLPLLPLALNRLNDHVQIGSIGLAFITFMESMQQ